MIAWLKQILRSAFARLWPRCARQQTVIRRLSPNPQSQAAGTQTPRPSGETRRTNPALQALREIFTPRHAAEEQVVFTKIRTDGVVIEKSEEWFHEGSSLKTVSKQSVVVTCSGAVVTAASIKTQCGKCGGFDAHLARCSHPECGIALCRLCQKLFTLGPTPVILCEKHLHQSVAVFDTWQALDRQNKQRRQ